MRELTQKKVLITGAASGIGRALALGFAAEGSQLWLLDVEPAGLAATALAVRQQGVAVESRCCDLTERQQITAAVRDLLDSWGTLDVLVNNAGVAYYGPTVRMTTEQCDRVLAVNLLAPIQLTRELLPVLLERPEAHVLNVASMYGFFPTDRATAYHASKFGLLGFSEALRCECSRKGLGVTTLCPGFVRTDFFAKIPCGRPGRTTPTPPRWLSASPETAARKGIRGVRRNQRLVLVTPLAYVAYYARRMMPGAIDRLYQFGRKRAIRNKTLAAAAGANTFGGELTSPSAFEPVTATPLETSGRKVA